jgi:hypothetical protein
VGGHEPLAEMERQNSRQNVFKFDPLRGLGVRRKDEGSSKAATRIRPARGP